MNSCAACDPAYLRVGLRLATMCMLSRGQFRELDLSETEHLQIIMMYIFELLNRFFVLIFVICWWITGCFFFNNHVRWQQNARECSEVHLRLDSKLQSWGRWKFHTEFHFIFGFIPQSDVLISQMFFNDFYARLLSQWWFSSPLGRWRGDNKGHP